VDIIGVVGSRPKGTHEERAASWRDTHHGTMLIDEISDMRARAEKRSPSMVDRHVSRGSAGCSQVEVEVSIVSSTTRTILEREIAAGKFRG